MVQKKFLIFGRVQGVGFRMWTQREARTLGVSGWVRNRSGGEVEVLLSGDPPLVAEMIERLHLGPNNESHSSLAPAVVQRVEELVLSAEDRGFAASSFEILRNL